MKSFSLIIASLFLGTLLQGSANLPKDRIAISDELLQVATNVLNQAGTALAPHLAQAQSSIGSLITSAAGSIAQKLLNNAQNTFGDVDFKNNVTIGDEPTDLLTVNANSQFTNNVIIAGNTTLGDDINARTTINGSVNNMFLLSKSLLMPFTTLVPLCTISFKSGGQSARLKMTLVASEGVYEKIVLVNSQDPRLCGDTTLCDGVLAGAPSVHFAYDVSANAVTINALSSAPLTNPMVYIECMPSAKSEIVALN